MPHFLYQPLREFRGSISKLRRHGELPGGQVSQSGVGPFRMVEFPPGFRFLQANPPLPLGHQLKEWSHEILSEGDLEALDA